MTKLTCTFYFDAIGQDFKIKQSGVSLNEIKLEDEATKRFLKSG